LQWGINHRDQRDQRHEEHLAGGRRRVFEALGIALGDGMDGDKTMLRHRTKRRARAAREGHGWTMTNFRLIYLQTPSPLFINDLRSSKHPEQQEDLRFIRPLCNIQRPCLQIAQTEGCWAY
jgi:hypothetical protein